MTDMTIPALGADSNQIKVYMDTVIREEYFPIGIGRGLGYNYLRTAMSVTPLEGRLLQLFMHVTDTLLEEHDRHHEVGGNELSTVGLIHKYIYLGDRDEACSIFFRWVNYLYNVNEMIHSSIGTIPKEVLARCATNEYPNLDEWGMETVFFVPMD